MAARFEPNPAYFARLTNQMLDGLDRFLEHSLLPTAKELAPSSAARTKSEAKRKPRNIHTAYRRGQQTLRKSGRVRHGEISGYSVEGGVEFTAPYAYFVHIGAGGRRGRGTAKPWLTESLAEHAGELTSGSFLKGNR